MALRKTRPTPSNASVKAFVTAAESYVEQTFQRFPSYGSSTGRHEFDAELERPTLALFRAHEKLLRETLAQIESLPEVDFRGDAWLDRRALLAELRTEVWSMERGDFRKNPERWASGALGSVHGLVVKHADDLKPVASAIFSRVQKLPAYLASSAEMLDAPIPVWTRMAEQSCAGAPSLLDAIAEPLKRTKCASAPRIATALARAKAAFSEYAAHIARLEPGPANGFSVGRERFEALIRERLGWDLGAREAAALGRTLVSRIEAEMAVEARKLGRGKPRAILERAAQAWRPARPSLFEEYEFETRRVREAFRKANVVSLPKGERLHVLLVPDFLRHQFPTAAYSQPGCYDRDQTGIFWVNDLSLIRSTKAEKAAEIRQHFGVSLTCAHEAYIGHHLQFCTANRHPSKLRRLFAHSVFYEGWTLWCEQMAVDQGVVSDPVSRLNQLNDALWRAHRILIDCGLQTGELSYDGAVKHLMKHMGFTRGRAEGDVNWYTMMPTVPMSYLLGKLEVTRLKQRKVDEQGWSLKRFNDWALSHGTLPWRWIEQSGL
ncbi:MAG TPA: DUF885 domain-containing protein [Polyangiaceae bacterium]|nr:DUF885 domain-containing protein [Polyangiaceae bacterium]